MQQVGQMAFGMVVKALPDKPGFFALINNEFAVLPAQYADKPFRVGDSLVAAVFRLTNPYLILSRTSLHYFRWVAEMIFNPLLRDRLVDIRAVATAGILSRLP